MIVVGAATVAVSIGAIIVFATGTFSHEKQVSARPRVATTPLGQSAPASPSAVASGQKPAVQLAAYVSTPHVAEVAGAFYGIADLGLSGQLPNSELAEINTLFASTAVKAKYWDASGKPTSAAMCGAKAPNVALVDGTGNSVTVTLFDHGQLDPEQAVVSVDQAAGKITKIECAPSTMPTFSGTRFVTQHFGAEIYQQRQATSSPLATATPTYAPESDGVPQPFLDTDVAVCAQYQPTTWVFFKPVATQSGDAWRFSYDGNSYSRELFTDPSTGQPERMLCDAFPEIPAPNKAAAGRYSAGGGPDPAGAMLQALFNAYVEERSQVSGGARPTEEMAPYFDSSAAYGKALDGTGAIPFLCGSRQPAEVDSAMTGKVSGSTETVEMDSKAGGPSGPSATTIAKALVTVDLATMKIKSIACQ